MKKLSIILILLVNFTVLVKAQSITYHALKVDMDFGFDPISAANSVSFTLEPHYRLSDELSLGLRFQDDATGSFNFKSEGSSNTDTKIFSSTTATIDYYLMKAKSQGSVLFFAGGGIGIFNESVKHSSVTTEADNLGFFPRLGLETGHFRSSLEYNITGGSVNYLSINVGFFFGGGKK